MNHSEPVAVAEVLGDELWVADHLPPADELEKLTPAVTVDLLPGSEVAGVVLRSPVMNGPFMFFMNARPVISSISRDPTSHVPIGADTKKPK